MTNKNPESGTKKYPLLSTDNQNGPMAHLYSYVALTCLLMFIANANGTTLSEAVNAQLATVSTPCERLLGTDTTTVLQGNLRDVICARVVPFGSTPQQSSLGSSNSSSILDNTLALLKETEERGHKNKGQIETQIGTNWSLFLTASGGILNRDVSYAENGYDSHVINVLAGSTYAINSRNTLGAAITLQRHTGNYTGGGDFKNNVNGLRVLETYHPSEAFFLQASAGYDSVSSQRTRNTAFNEYFNGGLVFSQSGTPYADYSYNQAELALLSGYNFSHGSFTLTPQIGLNWLNTDYGSYSETGGSGLELRIHDDKRTSLQSSLGLQVTNAISTHFGVILPQVDFRWKHEFSDKSRQVNVSFVQDTRNKIFTYDTEAADPDFFEISAGASFVFAKAVQTFFRVQSVLGQQYYQNTSINLGVNIGL